MYTIGLSIKFVCLLAAPEGIERFCNVHPDVLLYTAAIVEHGYIIPGLRDADDAYGGLRLHLFGIK